MPTARSSTDPDTAHQNRSRWAPVADLGPLLRFRTATVRGRRRRVAVAGSAFLLVGTVLAGWLPAYLPDGDSRRTDVLSLLPSVMMGVLVLAAVSAAASGGGRELVPRDQAVAFPVTPTTDHLGALLMAPLNIAWLLQSWTLLGATAYVAGASPSLVLSQVVVLTWLVTATSIAQVVGWAVELLRRGTHGVWRTRVLMTVVGLTGAYLVATDRVVPLLQRSPTLFVTVASLRVRTDVGWGFPAALGVLLLVTVAAVVCGGRLADAVDRRPARDELRLETSVQEVRPNPASDLAALMRTDRSGVWRSVPLRRGLVVLAVMPGLVAIAGDLQWGMLTILPGLVASGGALLFGVNSWCLDGTGALWRDSLPVDPRLAFASRALVLLEVLLVATAGTLVMAALRAGLPSGAELTAVVAAALVVVVQVVSASLRWSVRRPFSVDLRSSRATPAPPLVMVAYSARLAVSTTFVGILFAALARLPWAWSVAVAVPKLLLSAWRLRRTASRWAEPVTRCHVVTTVAG
ncbi:MAG: hypothetical protein QOK15_249 [Nocardioidaceae bacterium]|nr:hypothetical protein [Nocardioidaceae bacterium]